MSKEPMVHFSDERSFAQTSGRERESEEINGVAELP